MLSSPEQFSSFLTVLCPHRFTLHWVAKELTCADQDRAYDEECDRPLVKESKSKVVDADLTHAQKDFGRSLGDADRGRHGSSTHKVH